MSIDEYFGLSWWEFGILADRNRAKLEHSWNIASHVMALIANVNRDPQKKPTPFEPSDFNPFSTKKDEPVAMDEERRKEIMSKFPKTLNIPVKVTQDGK